MNLTKIRTSIIMKSPKAKHQPKEQFLFQTPKKIQVFSSTESTIDRTQANSRKRCSNLQIKKCESPKKYIKIIQGQQRMPSLTLLSNKSHTQSRKILTVSQIQQLHSRSKSRQQTRSKSKKKLSLTQSLINPTKFQSQKFTILLNTDSTTYMSVTQLMSSKTKKQNKILHRHDTPINLITQESQHLQNRQKLK